MEGASSINSNVYLRPQENDNDEEIKMVPVLKSQLPPFFCLDLLFKYALYDEACKFLYYRRENNDLLQMIRWEYEENKNQSEQIKKKIYKLKQSQHDGDGGGDSSTFAQTTSLEAKREGIRNQRNQWFFRHIEYIQKINDNSFFDNEKLVAAAEKYCDEKSEWVLKED